MTAVRDVEVAGRGTFRVDTAEPAPGRVAGVPAILLHGLGADATLWGKALPLLAQEHAVHAYDLRGHGATRAADDDFSLAAHAADLLALVDALLPGERPHVLGTSMGGVITQIAAAAAPGRFASLVLCCTTASAPPGLDADALADALADAPDIRAHFAGIVREMLPDHPTDAVLLLDAIARTNRAALVRGAREVFAYEGHDRLARIDAPALVVCAERDEMFPPAAAQAIAAGLRDARVAVLARAGHAPYVERPELFAEVVAGFWRERDAAAASGAA